MPKPYTLAVEVEEIAVGKVMRRINAIPGVLNIIMDFRTNGKPAKPNGAGKPRGVYEKSGNEAVLEALHGKPPMTTAQLRDSFVAHGRSPKSINSVLHGLLQAGDLRRTSDGYALTKKGNDRMRPRKPKKRAR